MESKEPIEPMEPMEPAESGHIRPLADVDRAWYGAAWQQIQSRFGAQSSVAIVEADALIRRVMLDRGYPVPDTDERGDLAHRGGPVGEHYRAAHGVAMQAERLGAATDEAELRRAMVHYRALFDELLGPTDDLPDIPTDPTTDPADLIHRR